MTPRGPAAALVAALAATTALAALSAGAAAQQPPPAVPGDAAATAPRASGKDPRSTQVADLAGLAAEQRWDDLMAAADSRLDADPADNAALYWKGRATLQAAEPLLSGRAFARDLADTMLRRARELLEAVRATEADGTGDALEWLYWSRYLAGTARDPALPADLERRFASDGLGYAAYLRGVIERDRGGEGALAWFEKAAAGSPARPEFVLACADSLATAGRRDEALARWDQAAGSAAPREDVLSSLLAVLPGADNAAARLARLDALAAGGGDGADDGLLQWHRAYALEQLGRLPDAEAAFARASRNRGADVERAHARLLRLLGRPADAAAHLLPGARAGDDPSLQDLTTLADALAQERRWDEALPLYDQVLDIEPNDGRAAVNRALLLAQSGKGLDGYQALVARHPGRADVLNDAALAELGWGHREVARALLERAVLLDGAIDARENLARLLLDGDPPDGARAGALLDAVLAEDPVRDRALVLRLLSRHASPPGNASAR